MDLQCLLPQNKQRGAKIRGPSISVQRPRIKDRGLRIEPIRLHVCMSVRVYICVSVRASALHSPFCPLVRPPAFPLVCPSVIPPVQSFVGPIVHPTESPSDRRAPARPSDRPFIIIHPIESPTSSLSSLAEMQVMCCAQSYDT